MRWTANTWNPEKKEYDVEYLFSRPSLLLIESLETWLEELTDAA